MRSLIGVDNLIDLIILCVDHPSASGQTFLVSDSNDLSTPDLIRSIASYKVHLPCFIRVPISLLRLAGNITGKADELDRLIGSLQIDSTHTKEILNWSPPLSFEYGIKKTLDRYLGQR